MLIPSLWLSGAADLSVWWLRVAPLVALLMIMSHTDDTASNAIENKLDRSINYYAKASWLRTTIIGIGGVIGVINPIVPAIVGTIDVALTIKAQKVAERRLNVLCQFWEQEMQNTSMQHIDKEYLESEEFFDLLIKVWDATKRTRQNEKISLYAQVLVGAIPLQNREQHWPEDYISILAELTLREIEVARALYKQQLIRPEPTENEMEWLRRITAIDIEKDQDEINIGMGQWEKLVADCPSVSKQDIAFLLLRLQRSGLAKEMSGTYWDYLGGVFVATEELRKIMAYLQKEHLKSD